MSPKHQKAIKTRRISILRLQDRPPADMTPEQVKRELGYLNAQIIRIQAEDKAEQ